MNYATQEDMEKRFDDLLHIADSDGDDVIDAVRVDTALKSASSIIDGYIAAHVELPLNTIPENLVDCACDIARYKLYADDAPETIMERYKAAIRFLEGISRGVVKIAIEGKPVEEPDDILVAGPDRFFSDDSLKGF